MMAIDPRIAMGVQVPNIGSSIELFQNTLNNIQGRKMNEQAMAQNEVMNPLRQQQAQQTVDSNQMSMDSTRQQQIFKQVADLKPFLDPMIQANDIDGVMKFLDSNASQLKAAGVPTELLDDAYMTASNGDLQSIKQGYDSAYQSIYANPLESTAVKPQSSKILADGTSIQVLSNGKTRVTSASGEELTGQDRVSAINAANQAEIELSGSKERTRTEAREDVKTDAEVKREDAVLSKRLANIKTRTEIDETTIKNEADKQEIINTKNARRAEAENAIGITKTLLDDDFFENAFGKVYSATPEYLRGQDSINANAQLEQITSLLSLESRQKLKGQGTITEGEAETLAKSATILNNRLISPELARKELRRVRNIFEEAADRNKLKSNGKQSITPSESDPLGLGL